MPTPVKQFRFSGHQTFPLRISWLPKTINLLNWVSLDLQKPVMAHELTHALQDQSFDLEKMMKKDEEIEKRGPEGCSSTGGISGTGAILS